MDLLWRRQITLGALENGSFLLPSTLSHSAPNSASLAGERSTTDGSPWPIVNPALPRFRPAVLVQHVQSKWPQPHYLRFHSGIAQNLQ